MSKAYVLSESDVNLLRELAQAARTQRHPGWPRSSRQEDPVAPDVYIARTPDGGIPALVEAAGTSERDQPGYATCTIYRIIGEEAAARLHPVNDSLSKTVYNINLERIGGNRWISVKRDKFGRWVVDSPTPSPEVDNDTGTGTDGISGGNLYPVFNDTGTGTGPDTGGPFGLWTGPLPSPTSCSPVVVVETDVFCEPGGSFSLHTSGGLGTGTGTDLLPTNYYLNLYKRTLLLGINRFTGCLESTALDWQYVRTIGCCEPECVEPDTGTGQSTAEECCAGVSLYHRVYYSLIGPTGPTIPTCTPCELRGYLYETDLASGTYQNHLGGSTCGGRAFLDLTLYCVGGGSWRASGKLRRYLPFIQDQTQTFDVALSAFGIGALTADISVSGCSDVMSLVIGNPCYSYNCTDGTCVEVSGSGGTYGTLAECEAACVVDPIATDCCPSDPIPVTLTGTFASKTGYAVNFPDTVSFVYNAGSWKWTMATNCGFGDNELSMTCNTPDLQLSSGATNIGPIPQTADGGGSCSPFSQTWTVSGTYGCGAMSYVLTITE